MEKYLRMLENQIWISDKKDNEIYDKLICERGRIEEILEETSENFNNHSIDWEHLEDIYRFEVAYKEKVDYLLTKLEM